MVVELNQAKLTNAWSAGYVLDGTRVTFTPASYNSAIAPQQSVSFGFCGLSTGSNHRPALLTLSVQGEGGGGAPDAGRPDAGRPDAGGFDAGVPDGGKSDAGGAGAGSADAGEHDAGGGACEFLDPPADVSAWINESWNAQLKDNISSRKDWLLDSAMKGKGVINLCVRWGASSRFTTASRDQIAPSMQSWFNDWFKALGNYGCFPYPNGITVKLTGVAVRPGKQSLLEWTDNSIPIYTETDSEGEPKCPDSCSFFLNWNHSFPNCAAGEGKHFDYSVWVDDSIGGGAAAVGGDWGVRMPVSDFIQSLGQPTSDTIEHEMGHGFGIQDYYDWTGSRPKGGSVMIVGSNWGGPTLTVGDAWLIRRTWKEQKAQRGW